MQALAMCIKQGLIMKNEAIQVVQERNLMQGIGYTEDRRAKKLDGEWQTMKKPND